MFGEISQQVEQRDRPALAVLPGAREGGLGQVSEQFVVFGPRAPEGIDRLRQLALSVIEALGPPVLVERRQRGIVLGDDLPQPHRQYHLAIGQMANDGPHAPLVFTRLEIEHGARRARRAHSHQFGSAPESFEQFRQFTHRERLPRISS